MFFFILDIGCQFDIGLIFLNQYQQKFVIFTVFFSRSISRFVCPLIYVFSLHLFKSKHNLYIIKYTDFRCIPFSEF